MFYSVVNRRYRQNWLVWVSVMLYGILSLAYLGSIPLGEAPDEPGHIQCVEQVAAFGRIPVIDPLPTGSWWGGGTALSGRMCYHMPLYYLVAGSVWRVQSRVTGDPTDIVFPPIDENFPLGGHPLFEVEQAAGLGRMLPRPIASIRLLSVGFGVALLLLTAAIAALLMPTESAQTQRLAVLLLAGWPQLLFMFRAVSNDLLAAVLAGAALFFILDTKRSYHLVWATLFCCLAVFAKITVGFSVGVLGLAYAWQLWKTPRRKMLWRSIGASTLISGAFAAFWLFHPTISYHLSLAFQSFGATHPDAGTRAWWANVWQLTLSSGFARFGWMDVAAAQWQANGWWLIVGGAAVVGFFWWWRRFGRDNPYQLFVVSTWAAGIVYSYIRINQNRLQPQFRFAFAILPLIAIFFGVAIAQLGRRLSLNEHVVWGVQALLLVAINGILLWRLVLPYYGYG